MALTDVHKWCQALDEEHSSAEAAALLSIPQWDLNWQRDFTFLEPKVAPREHFASTQLEVECTYHNYTDEPVVGGFGSDDEMCFNFSYVAVVHDAGDQGETRAAAAAQ